MARIRTISFRAWRSRLGPVMRLQMVPDLLHLTAPQVARLVERKVLPVHTFTAVSGRKIRVVKVADVDRIRRPKPQLTMEGMRVALKRMANAA